MGAHIIVNLYGCDVAKLKYIKNVKLIMNKIVEEAKLTKVDEKFYQFKPTGVTGVILLAESHISIHTWPEYKSAAVDIFCCSGLKPAEKTYKILIKKFKPNNHKKHTIKR